MSIYVVGDTHGTHDIHKVYKWYNKNQNHLTKEKDFLFQLGDWGAIWYYPNDRALYKKDLKLQLQWSKKNFTLCVIPGNHENYDLIEKLPVEEKWGGKVRVLKPVNPWNQKSYGEIYLLERGEIYDIQNKKILALGGAMSQDKSVRVIGESYWSQELWTPKQEKNCLENLDRVDWEVDYVFAHTCPTSIGNILLNLEYGKINDCTAKFFESLIQSGLKFKEWHFGHWHEDRKINNYFCHYLKEPQLIGEQNEN